MKQYKAEMCVNVMKKKHTLPLFEQETECRQNGKLCGAIDENSFCPGNYCNNYFD
jgi:hypothetical protein